MGIGGALAEARSKAGMTVTDVSARTRIRPAIISDIERDDYSGCGGDFYARGHIRAIARAVGTDPVPLIEEYDSARLPPAGAPAASTGATGPLPTIGGPTIGGPTIGGPSVGGTSTGEPDAAGTGAGGLTAAQAFAPVLPLELDEDPRRQVPGLVLLLALVLLIAVGVTFFLLGSGPSRSATPAHPAATRHAAASPSPSASVTPAAALVPLTVAGATAFGPSGPGSGDNPGMAQYATDGSAATAWQSDWYGSANFNGTQSGTGLLLTLSQTSTVTAVQLTLGQQAGGQVQIRAGTSPALADLPVVAQGPVQPGTMSVSILTPVTARYVLIWFTSLPPDNAGTYQAYVYNVGLTGTA